MSLRLFARNSLEVLETRIAPAAMAAPLPTDPNAYVKATLGGPVEVKAGQVLTSGGFNSNSYFLFVEKGDAFVFFTDLNNNKSADFNEITGISAGDGLRMTVFADIHGDIVTNLVKQTTSFPQADGSVQTVSVLSLSDSDSNPTNDPLQTKGDGRVLLNSTIEKIELRSLQVSDLTDQNADGVVDDLDVELRKVESTYSIYGNILAGKGFGAPDGGLIIDSTGLQNFGFEDVTVPEIGAIRTGTAAGGQFFTFGASRGDDISGTLLPFIPQTGQTGGDIQGLQPIAGTKFNLRGLFSGDGGIGARGGNISNIVITGDDTGGYEVIAGSGGRGPTGGAGGSILNFSDLGSNTSQVTIRSGQGGTGATGAGGAGGDFGFQTFNVRGNTTLALGDGGNGFTLGGKGASLATGTFSQPEPIDVIAGNAYGSTHLPSSAPINGVATYKARIGTHEAVDFDLDGFGDFVYTTKGLSQLVVLFGDGQGGFRTVVGPDGVAQNDRFYLNGARNAEALTVADLNGDGVPDIATGSLDAGSHAGVMVFLSQFEDSNSDGILTSAEDLNGNGINDFAGFSEARFSPLPALERGDADTANAILPFWESPTQISSIMAGDYNGDGIPELAVVATYYARKVDDPITGATQSLSLPSQVLMFLQPDREVNNLRRNIDGTPKLEYTGQFYADFGTKRVETPGGVVPAAPERPFFVLVGNSEAETVVVETTALSNGADHDVVIYGVKNGTDVAGPSIHTVDYMVRDGAAPLRTGTWTMGRIDNNRDLNDPGQNNNQDFQYLEFKDLTVVDLPTEADPANPGKFISDGNADLGVLGGGGTNGFVIGIKGTGNGGGATASGNAVDNAGNFIGNRGYRVGTDVGLALKSADTDGDGQIDDLVLWHSINPPNGSGFALLQFQPGILPPDPGGAQTTGAIYKPLNFLPAPFSHRGDDGPVMFDIHYNNAANLSAPSFGASDLQNPTFQRIYFISPALSGTNDYPPLFGPGQPLSEFGFAQFAGDGGDALVGKGGAGGSLGVVGNLGAITINAIGRVRLFAGDGGDGFSKGGVGGFVAGINLRGQEFTETDPDGSTQITVFGTSGSLLAGDGGRAVAGKGGNGGTLSNNSIQNGGNFIAGNGGVGIKGGNGGSVFGNGTGIFDTFTANLRVIAGLGGSGTKLGGTGGSIVSFDPVISAGTDNGSIEYVAGDGGSSVSGPGGNGGAILNSSPRENARLEGDIYLQSGSGGIGTTGGNGGSIENFVVRSAAQAKKPSVLSFVGGEGGYGVAGPGGSGGRLIGIDVQSRGTPIAIPEFANYDFNRALAGNGGGSATSRGGQGGDIIDFTSGADQGSFAVIAGAGGNGLTTGGRGGNVNFLNLATGASTLSKVLIIAGEGGSAAAFVPNPRDTSPNQDENSFGGTIGRGGKGGNIVNVSQTGQTGAHFDLIAGNGGDTINYGTVLDRAPFVGKGGSVRNVAVAGDIGNLLNDDPNTPNVNEGVAIKSYNDILSGQTVRQYVDTKFRDTPPRDLPPFIFPISLSDFDGNVGIVVGAAGRNKSVVLDADGNPGGFTSQPATKGENGKLLNLSARNLLAAVAGSVDRIASIQVVQNVQIVNGIIGADKGVLGMNDYLDKNGNPILPAADGRAPGPQLEGRLVDGAVVGKIFLDGLGRVITLGGRSFPI